jgi:hypothetical protein
LTTPVLHRDFGSAEDISDNELVFSSPAKMKSSMACGNAFVPREDRLAARTVAHKHLE